MTHSREPYSREPCECELAGPYYTGVPGILAAMQDGRVAPGAVVERCDFCRRYPSDAAALAKLRELALIDADPTGAGEPSSFTVQCYAVVRVEFPGIVADDQNAAVSRVLDRFDWDVHGGDAQLAESNLVVLIDDEQGSGRRPPFALICEEVEP